MMLTFVGAPGLAKCSTTRPRRSMSPASMLTAGLSVPPGRSRTPILSAAPGAGLPSHLVSVISSSSVPRATWIGAWRHGGFCPLWPRDKSVRAGAGGGVGSWAGSGGSSDEIATATTGTACLLSPVLAGRFFASARRASRFLPTCFMSVFLVSPFFVSALGAVSRGLLIATATPCASGLLSMTCLRLLAAATFGDAGRLLPGLAALWTACVDDGALLAVVGAASAMGALRTTVNARARAALKGIENSSGPSFLPTSDYKGQMIVFFFFRLLLPRPRSWGIRRMSHDARSPRHPRSDRQAASPRRA